MACFSGFAIFHRGIENQRLLGTNCSSKVLGRYRDNIGKERLNVVNNAIKKALEQKHAILMTIFMHRNFPPTAIFACACFFFISRCHEKELIALFKLPT